MKIVSVEQMRNLDYRTINEAGIPGRELMRRAGCGAGEYVLEYLSGIDSSHIKRFILLAGKGNNGGDAYVAASFLKVKTGIDTVVYSVCDIDNLQGDARYFAENLNPEVEFFVKNKLSEKDFLPGDIIIDGLLGTGFKGKLNEPYLSWIKLVNKLNLPVIALDIPSGLNGDDGSVSDEAFICDLTITMGMPKFGLILDKGAEYCGRIKTVDIGIPAEYIEEQSAECEMFTLNDARKMLKRIKVDSHKNSMGSVLVIGGSKLYTGAPFLAGKAALRSGAGLVTVAVPGSVQTLNSGVFSIILRKIEDDGAGYFTDSSISEIKSLIEKNDVIIVGPGMSDNKNCEEFLKAVLNCSKPLIIDADALNLISKNHELLPVDRKNIIFTPHPGEGKRLLEGFNQKCDKLEGRLEKALRLLKILKGTVVYKGNKTITVSEERIPCINESGGPALATAGSGDVLTGIIAAFAASGMDLSTAAQLAVYVHGLIGEVGDKGNRGLIADDIVELIPYAMKKISPFA